MYAYDIMLYFIHFFVIDQAYVKEFFFFFSMLLLIHFNDSNSWMFISNFFQIYSFLFFFLKINKNVLVTGCSYRLEVLLPLPNIQHLETLILSGPYYTLAQILHSLCGNRYYLRQLKHISVSMLQTGHRS